MELLKDLARWKPNLSYPAEPDIATERARLSKHLEAFEAPREAALRPPLGKPDRRNFRYK